MSYNQYLKSKISKNPGLKSEMNLFSWLVEVGINIAELRKNKGLTQKKLAEILGVAQSVVARIESGHNMQCSTLWEISMALKEDLVIFGASTNYENKKLESLLGEKCERYSVVGNIIHVDSIEVKRVGSTWLDKTYPSTPLSNNLVTV